uniref:Putative secreted protein n=1 Tax=Anopheles triannulatus TaxID=58253 RepID=A0A2M4B7K4_9DIPT
MPPPLVAAGLAWLGCCRLQPHTHTFRKAVFKVLLDAFGPRIDLPSRSSESSTFRSSSSSASILNRTMKNVKQTLTFRSPQDDGLPVVVHRLNVSRDTR